MRQTTVKDIANKLSLHYTTVSKALRDHPDISVETKYRVLSLAKELDYHPNSIAKSLKNHSTFTIGIIVPSIKVDFFSAVISGVEEVAYERGFNTVVCQSNEDHEREVTHVSTLISNRVDGVLISLAQTTKSGAHIRPFHKKGIPLVLFDRVCEDINVDKVVVDDYGGAVQVARHLIQSGYRNIAHIAGPENTSVGRDRYRGYLDELKRDGIAIKKENIIVGGLQEDDGVTAFRAFLSRKKIPEAIFAVNDQVAIGVYDEIKRNGLKIPQDVALVGFGNIKLSSYLDPPLTTVRQSPYKLGKAAAGMLLRRIENSEIKIEPKTEVIETELILRKST